MTAPLTAELIARALIASAVSTGELPAVRDPNPDDKIGLRKWHLRPVAVAVALAVKCPLVDVCRILQITAAQVGDARAADPAAFHKAQKAAREVIAYHLRTQELKARAAAADPDGKIPGNPAFEPPAVDAEAAPRPHLGASDERTKSRRGFAAMSPEKRREIAALGGAGVPAAKRSFSRDHDLAKSAGRDGGLKSRRRAFPQGARFENMGEGVSVVRLKPLTDSILRHARQQHARGVSVDDLADLFGVDPVQLRQRLAEGNAA